MLGALAAVPGCAKEPASPSSASLVHDLRSASGSSDGEKVGRWLLGELYAPGGDATQAAKARKQLENLPKERGLQASLARALADEGHGLPKTAAEHFMAAVVAAREAEGPNIELSAWMAAHRLVALRGSVPGLWKAHKKTVEDLVAKPGHLGWRAVAELVEWWAVESFDEVKVIDKAYDAEVTSRMGCVSGLRLAGPFGHGTAADRRRSFPAEVAPWPLSFPADPHRGSTPRIIKNEQSRCVAQSTEPSLDGVFYTETFVTTEADRDVVVAVQGAVKVWVDDVAIVERDLRNWGVWQRFGGAARLPKGRHRILARIVGDSASIRVLNLDGTAAKLASDVESHAPYGLAPAIALPSPNPIDPIVSALGRGEEPALDPFTRILVAHAAGVEGMQDVAGVILEPILGKEAAPYALELAASLVGRDPALPDELRKRNEKVYHQRAVAADPKLWIARAWLVLDEAEQRGLVESVDPMRKLVAELPDVIELGDQLARIYGKLGWRSERMRAAKDLISRFPESMAALRLYLAALDDDGALTEADAVAERIKKLDPDVEIDIDRALARRDWKAAVAELKKLQTRRPDRKDIAGRIADALMRGGDPSTAALQLEKALAKNPSDSALRLRLADRAYAKGDLSALRRALAETLQAGGKGHDIRDAVELLEGASALEPYRIDGRSVVKAFEAWEKSGKHMEGVSARVLDYSAAWVHQDGSSDMLEHEILKIQSQEAVGKESEQEPPSGLVLRIRVIKPDGSVLEPEPVAGKPTLTMPHLEVGDYLEIEHISTQAAESYKGRTYRGPHWFFREADKGYWRSEFVMVTPKDRPLEIEILGQVPPAKVADKGMFVERRWRMDESPPAPEEPDSVSPREFLPSVRVGWGQSLEDSLARLVDVATDETPLDPRLKRRALEIVKGANLTDRDAVARKAYDWVLENVQEGQENDGRRAILGKSGSRQAAFSHLLRQLGVPVDFAIAKNKLAMPARGKMSEIEGYDNLLLRVDTGRGVRWLTVKDKFAPYAYVPAEVRGQTAVVLKAGTPRETIDANGVTDGIVIKGRADLREDGSAQVELVQSFTGKVGIGMRGVFDKVPESKLFDFVETRLLTRNLPGARVRDVKLENVTQLGEPLVMRVKAEVSQLVRVEGQGFALKSLFPLHLAQLATMPNRQTPLLLGASSHFELDFQIVVPKTVRMPATLPGGTVRDGERVVEVKDTVEGHSIRLVRLIDIPAARVQPGKEYAGFVDFVQKADTLVEREIALGR
jgi:cellulose synthase operon protein C